MDGVFENILALVPVAAFIAYRIIASRRKQAAAQRTAPLPAREGARPAEPVFSAWELSANDPPPSPPAPAEPLRAEAITPEPAVSAVPSQGTFNAPAFPENLSYLPPLKRALVLTEILGPPKAW
ncbi:MAG: hypothetical protein LBD08_02945 [Treponema sp.]|jgi:hypothetical protein|nr:hypothetical protein [Treponema sp.]